ncbi:hypothetical protein F5883DRAFT_459542 [Diaporthe sp. PMI_573]|nr:hypothetical protein F5883DRAFT_459542 [Diaporthaceae sp. PMI_573]
MASYKKVALIGKGLLGSAVLDELVKGGFEVTVLGRSKKADGELPPNVRSVAVDYNDKQSLINAMKGQDAVVSTVNLQAGFAQKTMIDAAIEAGVKRFILSDFGCLTTNPAASLFPHHVAFVEIQKYIKSKSNEIEYTIFSIGAFTEYMVSWGIAFDWEHKKAQLWGDGSSRISSTSLHGTGKAIVSALKNPEPTKTKNLFVHELVVTQAQLLSLAKKYPPQAEWTITKIDDPLAECEKLEAIANKNPELPNIMAFLAATLMSGKFEAYYKEVDNELVGLPLLSEKDLERKFAEAYGDK